MLARARRILAALLLAGTVLAVAGFLAAPPASRSGGSSSSSRLEAFSFLGGGRAVAKGSPSAELRRLLERLDAATSARERDEIERLVELEVEKLESRPVRFSRKDIFGPWEARYVQRAEWQRYFSFFPKSNKAFQWLSEDGQVKNIAQAFGEACYVVAQGRTEEQSAQCVTPFVIDVSVEGGELVFSGSRRIPLSFIRGTGRIFVNYIDEDLRVLRSDTGGLAIQTACSDEPPS